MKQPLALGIYGYSNTGKTKLTTELIKYFTKHKYKIASVKITDKNISMDKEEKDTWKHKKAGADLVVFSTNSETNYLKNQRQTVKQIIENICLIDDYDIIFIEGANDEETPKIRIGDIEKRKNTIYTYKNDLEKLINMIKNMTEKNG